MTRKVFIGPMVLILLVAGAWWVLTDKKSQESSAASNREAPPLSAPPVPLPALPVVGRGKSDPVGSLDKPLQNTAQEQRKSTTEVALKFAGRANPDPALSKELEREIQYALDTSLDHGRFEVESIVCRGYKCQIVSVDRTPPPVGAGPTDFRQGWGPNLTKMLHTLKDAWIQNPSTGARIGKPELEQLELLFSGEGIVTYIGFKE